MNYYLIMLRKWYDQRNLRERLLFIALTFTLIYAFFALLFFRPINRQIDQLYTNIKKSEEQIINWKSQINALMQISETPLYKEWKNQHQSLQILQKKYNELLQSSSLKQWQDVINLILIPSNAITLAQVNASPQSTYQTANTSNGSAAIYQQKISLTIYGNYFDFLDYLTGLEKALPNVHWDKLDYQVIEYPAAKVEMEFSIFYEKTD